MGSKTNVSIESAPRRGAILLSDPDGRNMRIYAAGLRNAVGIGFNSESTNLWATVNERDDIGDDVPSDYFAHVIEVGFMDGLTVISANIWTIAWPRARNWLQRPLFQMC